LPAARQMAATSSLRSSVAKFDGAESENDQERQNQKAREPVFSSLLRLCPVLHYLLIAGGPAIGTVVDNANRQGDLKPMKWVSKSVNAAGT
jgi:hypothetical protein